MAAGPLEWNSGDERNFCILALAGAVGGCVKHDASNGTRFRAVPIRAVGRRVSLRVAPRSVAVVDRRARVVDGGVVGEGKCTRVTSRGGTSTFF